MDYEWDEKKREDNRRYHGLDFFDAFAFDWSQALIKPDDRRDYKEQRYVAMAPIEDRLYVMVYTERQEKTRIISFRKANRREVRFYVKNQDQDADEG